MIKANDILKDAEANITVKVVEVNEQKVVVEYRGTQTTYPLQDLIEGIELGRLSKITANSH